MYSDPFSPTTPAAAGIDNPDCVKWRETLPSQEESAGRDIPMGQLVTKTLVSRESPLPHLFFSFFLPFLSGFLSFFLGWRNPNVFTGLQAGGEHLINNVGPKPLSQSRPSFEDDPAGQTIHNVYPPSPSKFTPFCFGGFSSYEDILYFTTWCGLFREQI